MAPPTCVSKLVSVIKRMISIRGKRKRTKHRTCSPSSSGSSVKQNITITPYSTKEMQCKRHKFRRSRSMSEVESPVNNVMSNHRSWDKQPSTNRSNSTRMSASMAKDPYVNKTRTLLCSETDSLWCRNFEIVCFLAQEFQNFRLVIIAQKQITRRNDWEQSRNNFFY